jgi:hypothetical protein
LILDWVGSSPVLLHGEKDMKKKKKPKTTRPGTVEKIIKSPYPQEPEKAEIALEGADHLYREIRIENTLEDEKGKQVRLKVGAQVNVTVEADPKDTIPKERDSAVAPCSDSDVGLETRSPDK